MIKLRSKEAYWISSADNCIASSYVAENGQVMT